MPICENMHFTMQSGCSTHNIMEKRDHRPWNYGGLFTAHWRHEFQLLIVYILTWWRKKNK